MSYEAVDQTLKTWAAAHQLLVYTEFKDESVRSMDIVGGADTKVQIWIDDVAADGKVAVHLWDFGKRRKDLQGPVTELGMLLDDALCQATTWLDENANNL